MPSTLSRMVLLTKLPRIHIHVLCSGRANQEQQIATWMIHDSILQRETGHTAFLKYMWNTLGRGIATGHMPSYRKDFTFISHASRSRSVSRGRRQEGVCSCTETAEKFKVLTHIL